MTRRSPLALLCALAAALGMPASAAAQDATAPVNTTPLPPAGWLAGDYVVLLSGTDETAFDRMEWMLDGGAVQPPDVDGNATVSGEGVHTLSTRAVDAAGNDSGWRDDTVRIDLTEPVDSTAPGTTGWRSAPATVAVAASDALSGIDHVEWRLDGGAVETGTTVAIAGDGEHTLLTRAVDLAGNTSDWRTHTIRIDTVVPTDVTAAPAGWQTAPLLVSVAGSDAHSGVALVRYRVDGGLPQTGLSPAGATVGGDGTHTLETQVVDNAGNSTGWKSHTIRIDTTAPQNQTATADPAWRAGDYSVLVTGADGGSGLRDVEWRVNGGAPTSGPTGLQATITTSGANTFETRVHDVAGNNSTWRSETVRIDKVAPTNTTAAAPGTAVANPYRVPVTGTDAHSGVANVEWRVDGGSIQSGASGTQATVSGHGIHTLETRVTDNVGRTSGWRSESVRIDVALNNDTTDPTVAATGVPSGWSSEPVTVTLTAADTGAGVERLQWRLPGRAVQTVHGATTTIDFDEEGEHLLEVRARDLAENETDWVPFTVRVDLSVPADTTAIGPGWQNSASFTVAGDDPVSGIAAVEYRLDGGSVQRVASGTTVDAGADGLHAVEHRVIDRADHASAWKTDTLRVDTVLPVNTSAVPDSAWRPAALELDLDGTDGGSGIDVLQWRVDGGTVHDGGPAVVERDGVHTLETRAVDAAGNASPWREDEVRVDVSAPRNDTPAAPAGWRSTPWTVTVAGSDGAGSGVDRIERRLDGEAMSQVAAVTVAGDGVHTLRTRVVDEVGHASPWRTDTIRIDSVAAVAAVSCPGGGAWLAAPAACTVTGSGGPSGLASLTVALDGGPARAFAPGTYVVAADGVHRLDVRAVDGAGNRGAASASVRIDRSAPVASLSCRRGRDGHECRVDASDAVSGVASVTWSLDGGDWQEGTSFTIAEGAVRARVLDAAGNAYVTEPVELRAAERRGARSASLPVYLRGRRSSRALIGALRATRRGRGVTVDLRPLAVGRGRYKVQLRLKSGRHSRRVRRRVRVGRDGTLPRIRARLKKAPGRRCTVTLKVRKRDGRRWRRHATGRLVLER